MIGLLLENISISYFFYIPIVTNVITRSYFFLNISYCKILYFCGEKYLNPITAQRFDLLDMDVSLHMRSRGGYGYAIARSISWLITLMQSKFDSLGRRNIQLSGITDAVSG